MRLLHILVLTALTFNTHAGVEYKKFKDPQKEQAYRVLIDELRCLVCQNQTIADSNAELAKDLRRQVYEMLQQGKSQEEIVAFMTQRYGDFVMYNPPFKAKTMLLWVGPVVFLLIGLLVVFLISRRKKTLAEQVESSDEKTNKNKAKSLLNDGEQS